MPLTIRRASRRTYNKPTSTRQMTLFHKGHRLRIPNHPTEIITQPWFPLVVRVSNPANTFTFGDLYTAFLTQYRGAITFNGSQFTIRLLRIRVWGPIPATNTAVSVRFFDIFDDIVATEPVRPQILEEITNYADQVNRARVGYSYSSAQQQKALYVANGTQDKIFEAGGLGTGSVAYFDLLWRPVPAQLPAFDSTVDGFEKLSL